MTLIDPAVKYEIHKIESLLTQLFQYKVIDAFLAQELLTYACDRRDVDIHDYEEQHW